MVILKGGLSTLFLLQSKFSENKLSLELTMNKHGDNILLQR